MKRCLVDVNVCLALLANRHQHHRVARNWYETLSAGEAGLSRLVQLSLIRLLGNKTIMGSSAVSASVAWNLIQELLTDERMDLIVEPPDLDSVLPRLFRYRSSTGKLVTDAYLAAFAISASRRLVTLDRGFRQFRGLETETLLP